MAVASQIASVTTATEVSDIDFLQPERQHQL